ncbi:hypothetical protein L4C36_22390 [Photobacterium japonica]
MPKIYLICGFICSGNSFEMTDEMLTLFWSWFEEPGADEAFTLIPRDT